MRVAVSMFRISRFQLIAIGKSEEATTGFAAWLSATPSPSREYVGMYGLEIGYSHFVRTRT